MIKDPGLFLFPEAQPRLAEIDAWLSKDPPELFELARHWFEHCRHSGDDVTELLHDGCPTACAGDAAFAYVDMFKSHVNLGFFTGAFLDDPAGLLEGSGKRMRHIKLRPQQDINGATVPGLLRAAYADVNARRGS